RLLQRDLVGPTRSGPGQEDVPRLELQQPRGDRHGDEQGRAGAGHAGPDLLLHDLDLVPAQLDAGDREVLPDRHLAREDEPRLPPTLPAAPAERQADRETNLWRELRRPRREGGGTLHVWRFLPGAPARPWGNEAVRVGRPGETRLGRCDVLPAPPPEPGAVPY